MGPHLGILLVWGCVGRDKDSAGIRHDSRVPADSSGDSTDSGDSGTSAPVRWSALATAVETRPSCGLTIAGEALCWDDPKDDMVDLGVLEAPSGTYSEISVNAAHAGAIDLAGQISWWGGVSLENPSLGPPPDGEYHELQAGGPWDVDAPEREETAACALDVAGAIHCWHADGHELWTDPGPYTKISTVAFIGAGLREDGTITCWGKGSWYDCGEPPESTGFTDIACGSVHCCASDEVNPPVCWGSDSEVMDMVYPEVLLTRLCSGSWDTCGLELDGAAAWCWGIHYTGDYWYPDQTRIPERIPAPDGLTWQLYAPSDWGLTSDGQILDRDGNPPPVE